MSKFLRDERLRNLSISEETLMRINEDITEILVQVNQSLDLQSKDDEMRKKIVVSSYIIRFDNKGFRLYDFHKIMKYFQEARRVERFIFILESIESIRTSKNSGKSIELRFDKNDPANCYLVVQDDDNSWVDSAFCKIKERLSRYRNKNFLVQNRLTPFIIQLCGVVAGFFISLWLAIKISPKLAIDNALAFSFVIAFLLFSNIWTLIYEGSIRCLNYFWPNISFKERAGLHWIIKAIISSVFVAFFFFVLNRLSSYLFQMVKPMLK